MSSIYRRGEWFWYKAYHKGVLVREPLGTKDRTDAKIMQAEKDVELARSPSSPDSVCNKVISKYIETLKPRCSAEYVQSTERRLKAVCEGKDALRAITEQVINDHVKVCKSKYDANYSIAAVKAFMKWAERSGYIQRNPASMVKKIPIQERARECLDAGQIKRILAAAKHETLYPLVMIALYTGMRKAELLRLDWKDIDFKQAIITVKVSKSKKVRRIPISKALMPVLSSRRKPDGFICDLYDHRAVIERIFKKANVDGGWHHFRHTFCTMALRSGADIQTVCDLAGHSSPAVTAKYLTSTPSHLAQAVNRLKFPV